MKKKGTKRCCPLLVLLIIPRALFSPGLSIFWSQASTRGFSLHDVVRVMCEEPAKLSRLSHRKGKIAVGMDADFVLWDPEEAVVVKPKFLSFPIFAFC